ncbi:MAG: DUF1858 domain-containing protein [Lachnospiraceae bacterium]|nr:DUF1858 domain-containing protein [Lachnospiraceae bacterium]
MSIKDVLFGSEEEKAADEAAAEKAKNGTVSKDMLVGQIIMEHPAAADFLMSCGMGCIFCPSAQMESLEQAAMVHGLDADDICDALNETLGG